MKLSELEFEVRAGIEPAHSCFADSRVTSSPTHLQEVLYHSTYLVFYASIFPLHFHWFYGLLKREREK
jgi:hypothetical protein